MTALAGTAELTRLTGPALRRRARVVVLDIALLALAVPGLLWLQDQDRPFHLGIALLVTALFVTAEAFPIRVERGDRTASFTFTTVPLVVGLTLLPPEFVVLVRSLVALVVAVSVHRWTLVRAVTGWSVRVLQTVVAALLIVPLVDGSPRHPEAWAAVAGGVLASRLVGTGVALAARSLDRGRWAPEALAGASAGWIALGPDILLALVAAIALDADPESGWLVAGTGVLFVLLVRLYVHVSTRYRAELRE